MGPSKLPVHGNDSHDYRQWNFLMVQLNIDGCISMRNLTKENTY